MNDLTPEVKTVALNLMEGLACSKSLGVAILIRHGEWTQLSELKTDPHHYLDSESYWAASAATDFLRKFSGLPTGISTSDAAIQKWKEGEIECFKSNLRLSPYLYGGPFCEGSLDERIFEFISKVRKEVIDLIGEAPPNLLQGKFGPGATLSDKSRFTTVNDKLSSVPTLTHNAWPHLVPWTGTMWAKACAALEVEVSFVEGNHFFTVPKDATTDRACAKEPSLNAFYQAACGKAIRQRLKANGIDLRNGQFIHRRVACLASYDASYCTIDLSNASDTIGRVLVELLLPKAWFVLLDSLRSPKTFIEGKWVRLEKFSSMGNGFTFELETALFAAIARASQKDAASRDKVLTYGDDILVPNDSSSEVIAALRFCGFTPNKRKTYDSGMFRESCGGDFFGGVAVRPHYLKEEPLEPQDFISLANGIRRLALQEPKFVSRWHCVRRAWFSCLDFIPSNIRRLRGPEALGDIVVHDHEVHWETRSRHSIRYVQCYRPARFRKVRWEGFAYDVQFAAALYLAGTGPKARDPNGDLVPRDSVLGYKVGWTPYS